MALDITVTGNAISGRQGWAYICNSGKFSVLKVDIDKPRKFDNFQTFDNVRVAWNYRGQESYATGTLEVENGKWKIGGHGSCIKSSFTYEDSMKLIDGANAPIVRTGDIVVLAMFSENIAWSALTLYRVGKTDIHCMTIADLIPLSDEEMEEVKNDAKRWCNR